MSAAMNKFLSILQDAVEGAMVEGATMSDIKTAVQKGAAQSFDDLDKPADIKDTIGQAAEKKDPVWQPPAGMDDTIGQAPTKGVPVGQAPAKENTISSIFTWKGTDWRVGQAPVEDTIGSPSGKKTSSWRARTVEDAEETIGAAPSGKDDMSEPENISAHSSGSGVNCPKRQVSDRDVAPPMTSPRFVKFGHNQKKK